MNIYVTLDPYLAQWFVNDHGGTAPVKLRRGSIESKILEVYLARRPDGLLPELPGPDTTAIEIPCFKIKPPATYNHLPARARAALLNAIRERFDIDLWTDLHKFGKIGRNREELIWAWMEKNNIDLNERNWNAIAKRYQRQRDLYLQRERSKKQKFPRDFDNEFSTVNENCE